MRAEGTNLANSSGLTEGNPRIDKTLSAEDIAEIDVFMGRPVLPRRLTLSASYFF